MFKTVKVAAFAVGISSLVVLGAAAPALAWHPQGEIAKYVQNQTTGSALSDANTTSTAVEARPGDVLKYVVEIRNTGAAHAQGHNDMAFVQLTDTLPSGVELVSNPAQRTITESLGTVAPGKKVTKEYLVKVTSKTKGDVITNKACFTGDSAVKDSPQKGCDPAVVKVTVPEQPVTPTTPVTPVKSVPASVTTLPETGNSLINSLIGVAVIGGMIYAAVRFIQSKRAVVDAIARR